MSRLYIGGTPISSVYMGGKRYDVKMKPNSKLPTAYSQLEYIESTGTQYIDTGITARYAIGMKCDFQTQQNSGCNLSQVYGGNKGSFQIIYMITTMGNWSSQKFAGGYDVGPWADGRGVAYGDYDANRHTLNFNISGDYSVTFDSVPITLQSPIYSDDGITATIPLFCSWVISTGTAREYAKMKLYSCSMYDSGELVRDFIPARRVSDSKIGLYDTVSKTFFTDVNGGNFLGGNPV